VLQGNDTTAGDWFGYALDIREGALAVGAPSRPHPQLPVNGVGAVYLFGRVADGPWEQNALLVPDDGESAGADAGFGWDVWLGDRHVGVGAWLADNVAGTDARAAYVYRLAGPPATGAAIADAVADREAFDGVTPAGEAPTEVELVQTFGGHLFTEAIDIAWLPDGSALVAERNGRITSLARDGSRAVVALELSGLLFGEALGTGLLSMALDPQFAVNSHVWIYYTADPDGRARLSRFSVGNAAIDPSSELVVLEIEVTGGDEAGGAVRFGPDGFLYAGIGDPVVDGVPTGDAQNLGRLGGSVIRIDVSDATSANPYVVPADNPFVALPGARTEIWAYGLHDPRRMEFDAATGDLWVGDVGYESFDEINRVVDGGNYGWSVAEGDACLSGVTCELTTTQLPVFRTPHAPGCGIIGGPVYRGGSIPGLTGAYIFSELCTGLIFGFDVGSPEAAFRLALTERTPLAFAAGPAGGLFFMTPGSAILEVTPVDEPATADIPYFSDDGGVVASD